MATMTINLPDAHANRIIDAFAVQYGWSAGLGVTKAQFAKSKVIEFIKDTVKHAEQDTCINTYRASLEAVNEDVNGIGVT
jgi:hypothetical protein